MAAGAVTVVEATTKADRGRFIDLIYRLYARDPHWVPPLRGEARGLIEGIKTNPWFEHGRARYWLALRDGKVVGRISAQVDRLVLDHMGPHIGHWGLFECEDDQAVAGALLGAAEAWLRGEGMTTAMGPFSISIWDEPGLLVDGFDRSPAVMMGHHLPYYAKLIEAHGYRGVKDLHTYELPIDKPFPDIVQKIVAASEKSGKFITRTADKTRFAEEAAIVLGILNDAWQDNWGFVPLTPLEVAFVGKKLKPIVYGDLVRIAEIDGKPVAFMIALPDVNEIIRGFGGRLFPFNWIKLLLALRKPKVRRIRVPLMGVIKPLQGTRLASMMAFQMIEYIRRASFENYGATRGEIGWILEDNGPMRSIADVIESKVTRTYRIYERAL
ncbi:MAG: N-acetyltransferase [Sphingomonadaceae bacterium]|nr:N-acetyltransferase [Sphingomonadaceae bacterium]